MRPLLTLLALALPGLAHAQELRFTDTAPGGITSTGNTLGLAKASSENGPGALGSIGTFLAVDPTSVDNDPENTSNPWPAGTTHDWTENGSTGYLLLPERSEVLYAELVWAGGYDYGGDTVTTHLDDDVALTFGTDTADVTPDADTKTTLSETAFSNFNVRYYIRSADVTAFVRTHGEGNYTVSGVPATQTTSINSLNAAGWTLVVAYRSDDEPIRNLTVFVGGSFVDEDTTQDYTADGFCAPPTGPVVGEVLISALEGDADLTGDKLAIAPTSGDTFVDLSAPNNPITNMFASQINDDYGELDTSGSFGSANHDAGAGTNASGARQGWDLTTLALSDTAGSLENAQTSAVLRATTTGDSFLPTLLAFEIDVNAPNFTQSGTTVSPTTIGPDGGQLTVTATLKNTGEAPASNLSFKMSVPAGLSLASYQTNGVDGDANGTAVTSSALQGGVPAGTLAAGADLEVEMVFDTTADPDGDLVFEPSWAHEYVTCTGEAAIDDVYSPAAATVTFQAPQDTGDTGDTEDTDVRDTDVFEGDKKCGCASTGTTLPWTGTLGLLSIATVLRRRRGQAPA